MMTFFLFAFLTTLSFCLLIPSCPLPPVSFALLSPGEIWRKKEPESNIFRLGEIASMTTKALRRDRSSW